MSIMKLKEFKYLGTPNICIHWSVRRRTCPIQTNCKPQSKETNAKAAGLLMAHIRICCRILAGLAAVRVRVVARVVAREVRSEGWALVRMCQGPSRIN